MMTMTDYSPWERADTACKWCGELEWGRNRYDRSAQSVRAQRVDWNTRCFNAECAVGKQPQDY
jgi:hypothetical protein